MLTIYNMDVREALKRIPSESIDCIITSPPYYGLRNYDLEPQIWGGAMDCEHEFENNYCKKCSAWKGNLGLENTPQEYVDHLLEIFTESMRVLKKSGVFFLNIGDSYATHRSGKDSEKNISGKDRINSLTIRNAPNKKNKSNWNQEKQKLLIPHRVAIALQEKGFIIRDDIVWVKKLNIYPDKKSIGSTMPFPVKDKLLPATEYIFQIVKSKKYYFNLEDVKTEIKNSTIERAKRPISSTYTNDIKGNPYVKHEGMQKAHKRWANQCVGKEGYSNWNPKVNEVEKANPTNAIIFRRMNQNSKKIPQQHFASFPFSLVDFFIKIGCPENGIVLDPFVGSGTTLWVARKLHRDSIGIELNPEYVKIIKKRLFKGNQTLFPEQFQIIDNKSEEKL